MDVGSTIVKLRGLLSTRSDMKEEFAKEDEVGYGTISSASLSALLARLGAPVNRDGLADVLDFLDVDDEDRVPYSDLVALLSARPAGPASEEGVHGSFLARVRGTLLGWGPGKLRKLFLTPAGEAGPILRALPLSEFSAALHEAGVRAGEGSAVSDTQAACAADERRLS